VKPIELFKIYSENNAKNQHYVRAIIFMLLDMDLTIYPEDDYICLYNPFIYNLHIAGKDAQEDYINMKDYYRV